MKRAAKDAEWKKKYGYTYTAYKKQQAEEEMRKSRLSN